MIIRDTVAIKSVGSYFIKQSDELINLKKTLEKQIREIEEQFIGRDSKKIILKLESALNDLNLYINNLNYYGEFMVSLAEHDYEVLVKTKKNLMNVGVLDE